MHIDCNQTIELCTALDTHPLPSIDSIINEVAKWKRMSTFDLMLAYLQIKIRLEDRSHTTFLSGSELNQLKALPFGSTNAVQHFNVW